MNDRMRQWLDQGVEHVPFDEGRLLERARVRRRRGRVATTMGATVGVLVVGVGLLALVTTLVSGDGNEVDVATDPGPPADTWVDDTTPQTTTSMQIDEPVWTDPRLEPAAPSDGECREPMPDASTIEAIRSLVASPDVAEAVAGAQLEAVGEFDRVTFTGFRLVETDLVELCGWVYERLDGELHVSIDAIAVVRDSDGGWQVARWIRGNPIPQGEPQHVSVGFLPDGAGCGVGELEFRELEVADWADNPGVRAWFGLRELLSGPEGRGGGVTFIPPDVTIFATPTAEVGGIMVWLSEPEVPLSPCEREAMERQIIESVQASTADLGDYEVALIFEPLS